MNSMKKLFLIPLFFLIISSGCIEEHKTLNLSITREQDIIDNDASVKVAIASVISPKESVEYYEEMIQYISKKLGGPIKIVHKRTYKEINDLIKNEEIDFAFVCSGPYVEGNSEFGMKLLVAPRLYGKTTYNSYIIVHPNSSYTNLSDLRGKRFAFTDPLSNSGWLYPAYRLSVLNETPESFFGTDNNGRNNYFYTYSHDNSIIAVADRLAEGAAVNSQVYNYLVNKEPQIISRTRIIEVSPLFANPPVVVSRKVDPFLEKKLKDIFLEMDKDEKGKMILSNIMIDRFVTINDSAYDSIREMRNIIK